MNSRVDSLRQDIAWKRTELALAGAYCKCLPDYATKYISIGRIRAMEPRIAWLATSAAASLWILLAPADIGPIELLKDIGLVLAGGISLHIASKAAISFSARSLLRSFRKEGGATQHSETLLAEASIIFLRQLYCAEVGYKDARELLYAVQPEAPSS